MDKQPPETASPHLGHRERLRARFESGGLSGFAPHEALELLLTYAIPRQDVNPLAHRLITHFGGFKGVMEASEKELRAVPGVGASSAVLIAMLLPLFRMYERESLNAKGAGMNQEALFRHCRNLFLGEKVEHFYALSLDGKGRLLDSHRISSGDEGETAVYPRLIAKELLRTGAVSCVLAHNHPSGAAAPSGADIDLTRALRDILSPLSIRLKDHIIISGAETYSFTAHGLI